MTSQTVKQALSQATLYSDQQDYQVIQLPKTAIMVAAGIVAEIGEPFCALIVDKDEVSLVIPSEALADFGQRLPNHQTAAKTYRLITLDIALDMNLVGLMARVSEALAEAQVSILPLAAYTRDHILVPSDQFDIAMAALETLKSAS